MNRFIFLIAAIFLFTVSVSAQTKIASPSAKPSVTTPTKTSTEKNIDILKEKIADKVGELRGQNKEVTTGIINSVKTSSIELTTSSGHDLIISIDDALTKIYDIVKNQKKEIKIANLKKNDYIIIVGPVVENTVSANDIYRDTPYIVSSGQITNIDKDQNTLDIITTDKEELTLDVEVKTKQQIMDIKTLNLSKTGFSKYKSGDTINFVAEKPTDKKASKVSVLRILVIPQEFF